MILRNILKLTLRSYSSGVETLATCSPRYPPILDLSPEAVKRREREKRVKNIEALNTVEEKLFAINLEKYYGWKSIALTEQSYPYNFLPFAKYITRTYFVDADTELFSRVHNIDVGEVKELIERVRPYLQDAIIYEIQSNKLRKDLEHASDGKISDLLTKAVVERINDVILSTLSTQYPHLLEFMVDYEPRVEAFWLVGKLHPYKLTSEEVYTMKREHEREEESDEKKPDMIEHHVQYFGKPSLQLRASLPLRVLNTDSIIEYQNETVSSLVPPFETDPVITFGVDIKRRHGTNIPGFWPGDKCEFGSISYHHCGHLKDRPPHFEDQEDTLKTQAILANFAWLHGQANYQGFSTFTELTYPLVNQSVITDGKNFAFYLYQMNTTLLHSDHAVTNPRVNVCIGLKSAPLYQEIKGNEFIGWSDSVLGSLLTLYLNKPQVREGVNLKPYVNPSERYLCDITEDERRIWLHNQFRHMYSNRPRHRLPYEIYDWERIYKIKFDTRPLEKKVRPFEVDENPLEDRRYFDHSMVYIPRKFRPGNKKHWMGWKAKRYKTYYPEV